MLKLKDIKKTYFVADTTVEALKGINLCFRKNEFVSILGPSGCGKTTMLNIIGGLDQYTSGDLTINGRSTKEYKDRDWDVYRNHRIGFIFQSYNLIPHQNILGNVELALTISGISKTERIERAKKALDRVGLANQYYKKPNQLSGGQCQRVAIARALVNEPEILLADEPTGALDTVTSVQIMDLIQEIAKERLVIMVTHNPDLAYKYSTRIVKLLDGNVLEDSNPYSEEEEAMEVSSAEAEEEPVMVQEKKQKTKEKAKMSFWTAFKLSAKNLWSKRGRTIMVGFAGSIGIIGVSLVLAVSSGIRTYIADMQEDMLSGNPITITQNAYDLDALMNAASFSEKVDALKKEGYVNVNSLIEYLAKQNEMMNSIMIENKITPEYVQYLKDMPSEYYSAISFGYGIDVSNNIYTDFYETKADFENKTNAKNLSLSALKTTYTSVLGKTSFAEYSSYITQLESGFQQLPADEDYILQQYDLIAGSGVAKNKNEVVLVLDQNEQLTDLLLAQLGYYSQDEFLNIAYKTDTNSPMYDASLDKYEFSYEELLNKKFIYYPNDTVYTKLPTSVLNSDFTYHPYSKDFIVTDTQGVELTVTGILRLKDNISYGCLDSGIYYTKDLTEYILNDNLDENGNGKSEIVKYMQDNKIESIESGITIFKNDPENPIVYGLLYQVDCIYEGVRFYDYGICGQGDTTSILQLMMGSGSSDSNTTSIKVNLTMRHVGGNNLSNDIRIYPSSFKQKDNVIAYLDAWNETHTKITYTDMLSLVISMINTMIDIVTIALICFTAISLLVSTVMIGIITYVSVVERVKEIGVIRSLGGRKKDVSHLFNAETFIIGLVAGVFGIAVTYILSLIINLIIGAFVGIYTIASLPVYQAFIMILISIILTCISGLIPARSAAKKDPVVALRTE